MTTTVTRRRDYRVNKELKMAARTPTTSIDLRFGSPDATATEWSRAERELEQAEIAWLTTIHRDGRPHVAPLMPVLVDGTVYVCTGADEQKAQNLARDARCTLITGRNSMGEGLDVVFEATAVNETDNARLQRVADAYLAKYGEEWRYTVRHGAFYHGDGSLREDHAFRALVFELVPAQAFGFLRGATFSQTRWRF